MVTRVQLYRFIILKPCFINVCSSLVMSISKLMKLSQFACIYGMGDESLFMLMGFEGYSHAYYEKKGVLQLALQFNFWVANDTCKSLYLYAMKSNKQVAWVLTNKLHELQSCNSPYIWCNSLQFNCNSVKITHLQLLFNFIITTPMMSCWRH